MSRFVPAPLQSRFDMRATTRCRFLRIKPAREAAFGYCSTNRAYDYDDGDGQIRYQVMSGFDNSAVVSTGDAAVDNAEATMLLLSGGPVTKAKIDAGVYDGAEFTIYEVDYTDLSLGHKVVQHGYFGKVKARRHLEFSAELRSLIDLLRQSPWEQWQMRCRVKQFMSQPGEERFPCMYAGDEWIDDVAVTSVGIESNRTFTAGLLLQDENYFAPGLVVWTTGPNAGLSFEVEAFGVGGVITLGFPTPYPISATDEFNIRRDCSREWSGHNSCETYGNRLWFRGEPKIKPADQASVLIPGTSVGPGSGGDVDVEAAGEVIDV